MKKNTIRRVLSILVLTMVVTSMVFTVPVTATPMNNDYLLEYGNRVQARYTDPNTDIALGKTVTASSALGSQPASVLVDGITTDLTNVWIGGNASNGEVQTIDIDLWKHYYIDRWVVKNAKHIAGVNFIPRAYNLSYQNENGDWVMVDSVTNTVGGRTDRILTGQIIARYLRITFTLGCAQNNQVPVAEVGIYNSRGYVGQAGDILTTETSNPDHSAIAVNSELTIEAAGELSDGNENEVCYKNMSKWMAPTTTYHQVTVLRVKNATVPMAQGARNYAISKIGAPYNYNLFDYKNTTKFYCNSLVYRCWRSNGVKAVNLDSDVVLPPITVSDIKDDNDVYVAYNRYYGFDNSNIVW